MRAKISRIGVHTLILTGDKRKTTFEEFKKTIKKECKEMNKLRKNTKYKVEYIWE